MVKGWGVGIKGGGRVGDEKFAETVADGIRGVSGFWGVGAAALQA